MKKTIVPLSILMIILGLVLQFEDLILVKINDVFYPKEEVILGKTNEYYRAYDFNYVKNINDFEPQNKDDIINIYYTAINAGKNNFSFYCPEEYTSCIEDIKSIAHDRTILSDINNYVHPFNGFTHIETKYDSFGEVTINIIKSYTQEEIEIVQAKVDELSPQLILPNQTPEQNIKNVHDYIINNSVYDTARTEQNVIAYKSDLAYGPLIEGYGICGGYTDAMQLFLEKMGIKSFKVSSETHIWNAVYLNDKWHHLDLTWDDPVTPSKTNVLSHEFFLIPTNQLLEQEKTEHNFNQNIYSELK